MKCVVCKSWNINPLPQKENPFLVFFNIVCHTYIHHINSSSFNTVAGLKSIDRNNNSSKFSGLDTNPYFPQQNELQHTITKFNQSFLSSCENKTHKRRTWPANHTYSVLYTVQRKHRSLNSNLYNACCHVS
jgi:hypothetical protein